jgi:protein involved in sex pheromone biosynthesis
MKRLAIVLVGLGLVLSGCSSEPELTLEEILKIENQKNFNECMASANSVFGDSPEFTEFVNEACFPLLD